MSLKDGWRGVPIEHEKEWRRIFWPEKCTLFMKDPCPACGEHALHCYMKIYRRFERYSTFGFKAIGSGGLWEWCSNCRIYEHSSALIPASWDIVVMADLSGLGIPPDILDDMLEDIAAGKIKTKSISSMP